MPRPRKSPTRQMLIRIPETLYAELLLLRRDEIQGADGFTKYGGPSGYIQRLIREDLEKLKEEIYNASPKG